jgi:DNA-binding NtrC family response regulator
MRPAAKEDASFIEIARSFAERAVTEHVALLVRLTPSATFYIPIRGTGSVFGVLYLEVEAGEGLGNEDLQLLSGLAHQAGLASERIRRCLEAADRGDHWLHALRDERIMVGKSDAMKAAFNLLLKAAGSEAPVLLEGEPGTGKELAAQFIYLHSARHPRPFVTLNFAALPPEEHESALWSGAAERAAQAGRPHVPGAFEEALGGTLFLAEIGQMSAQAQDRLVALIEEGRVAGLPNAREAGTTVRVIAATSRRIERLVMQGNFRVELHVQLGEMVIPLPSLRDRKADIPELARHFLDRYGQKATHRVATISSDAMDSLANYPWPGNVRQLKNCIEAAVLAAKQEQLGLEDLPSHIR